MTKPRMLMLAWPLLLTSVLLPERAIAVQWQSTGDSRLGFRANAQGEGFEGRFTRFSARIDFAPDRLDASRFEVEIDLGSVDSQNSERDDMLADPAFFDSATQPTASYFADRFEATGDGRFRADGALTLRGITEPVALHFRWSEDGASARLTGEATLDRLRFRVGDGDWADPEAIAHEVTVMTSLELTAVDGPAP